MRDKLTSLCGQIYNLSFKVVSFFIKKMQFLYQKNVVYVHNVVDKCLSLPDFN